MSRLPPFPERIAPAELDWQDGTPVSRQFGDVYFSLAGGIAETTHVFLDNNDLPARFRAGGFHAFTIGETGFGTGLNFLVVAQAFLALAPAEAQLHFVSVEKFPLTPADIARAHAHWPELATLADELRGVLPPACSGFHRRSLADGRIRLTLLYGDAAALLPRLSARVDAWFLDGFAPAKNDDLWTSSLFAEIARLSAPGATFATFTAAGDVRRGLASAGFSVEKVAGFGRKRDMLRGARIGATESSPPARVPGRVAVIGGGLAGCAAARALAERGWQVDVFERNDRLAAETSGNDAGAVYPKFSVHETPQNRWYRDSYLHALATLPSLLGEPDGLRWSRCGLLQLPESEGTDHAAIVATQRWPDDVVSTAGAATAGALTGMAMPAGGLWFAGAGWVHPPALCEALAAHPRITLRLSTPAASLLNGDGCTQVNGGAYDVVVIANALAANTFAATAALPLRRVRGQVTLLAATESSRALRAIVCHDGYATPARNGLHSIGATFRPRDPDPSVRTEDDAENLAKLAAACPALHAALGGEHCSPSGARTGFRTQTPDYLPIIGQVVDEASLQPIPGLYVLTAMGAKGIAFSLLGAEIIAAQVAGEPLPVDSEVASALDPGRFLRRALKRQPR